MTDRLIALKESDALRAMPGLNPQALIAAAIDKGAGIETLERLVQLAKDVRSITAQEAYNAAMSEFQKRCPPIKKNKKMIVQGRPDYKYSDLGEIDATISPLMGELGLSKSWRAVEAKKPNHVAEVCRISHRLGHWEDSGPTEMPYDGGGRMNSAQSIGSAKTYAKRYSLCDILGISPEDDDDGQGTGGRGDTHMGRRQTEPQAQRGATGVVEPEHAPADPDDPALVTESASLFPDPQDDVERERIWTQIVQLSARIEETKTTPKEKKQWKDDKAAAWTTNCGTATPSTADLASLNDLKKWLEARQPK